MFCEHTFKSGKSGLCSACAQKKPYYSFKYCKAQCFACKECGYFYGSGSVLEGKPVMLGHER